MGSKTEYIEKMSYCKDWVIWVTPREYRLLRLRGVTLPIGISFKNQSTFIFNGSFSFSMKNGRYGMYKCSQFKDESTLFKRMVKEIGEASVSTISKKREHQYNFFLEVECSPSEMRENALLFSLQYTDFSRSFVPSLFLWGAEENKISVKFDDHGVYGVWHREKKAFTKTSSKDVFLYESEGILTKRIIHIRSINRL